MALLPEQPRPRKYTVNSITLLKNDSAKSMFIFNASVRVYHGFFQKTRESASFLAFFFTNDLWDVLFVPTQSRLNDFLKDNHRFRFLFY